MGYDYGHLYVLALVSLDLKVELYDVHKNKYPLNIVHIAALLL